MKHVKLQHLRFFVAIYEERSITAAAKRVHATQSGVSMQLRYLEDILGVKLFERASTGVIPTKAGDRIYWRAARILLELGGLERDVEAQTGKLHGIVRVGIMPTFSRSVLAPVLERFSKSNEYVEVKVTEGYSSFLTQRVIEGTLDFAVVPSDAMPDGLRSNYLDTDIEILATATNTDRKHLEPVALSNLDPLKLVLPGPENARRPKIDAYLSQYNIPVHSIMELDSMMSTLDIIGKGEWVSILPGCLCLPDVESSRIKLHPITMPAMTVDYILIEPATKSTSVIAQMFIDDFSAAIREACETGRQKFQRSE
ncbi:MAG: LysR family transcriptional regulator [Pseudomonadota bacterium]